MTVMCICICRIALIHNDEVKDIGLYAAACIYLSSNARSHATSHGRDNNVWTGRGIRIIVC